MFNLNFSFLKDTYVNEEKLHKENIVINTNLPVYITLSTIPGRIPNTAIIIKHFLKKVSGFEKIIVNIPYRYKRFPNLRPNISDFDDINDPRFILNRCQDDGPITKMTGSLDLIPPKSITIICDDMCYNLNAFKEIAEKQDLEPHKAFSFYVYKFNNGGTDALVPQGADIISVNSKSLINFKKWKEDLMDTLKLKSYRKTKCFFVDDLVIGWYFQVMGIKMEQVDKNYKNSYITDCEISRQSDNLNNQKGENSRENAMNTCYLDLNTFNPL